MAENRIKNFEDLATDENRRKALLIAEAGLFAIDTEEAMRRSVSISGDKLKILDDIFILSEFNSIKVVGFGKASCAAAATLEKIMGTRISEGAVIGLSKGQCEQIEMFVGTHPKPSLENVAGGRRIFELLHNSSEKDLVIALVSGGGSALLCSSERECEQGIKLYEEFLNTGQTISELNTIRKHLSILKGGGVAKIAYPATVIGLIFSDVPGDNFATVASGPTYKDVTTIADAERIIRENKLGKFELMETPKEDKYFAKVKNFVLVSNTRALQAMSQKASELGLEPRILSAEIYDEVPEAVDKIFKASTNGGVVIAGGEPKLRVPERHGKGGRNLHMALSAIHQNKIEAGDVFISIGSDGLDNSDAAGGLADLKTVEKMKSLDLDSGNYYNGFNSYGFFEKTGDMLKTGPTGSNVSDLMILLSQKDLFR